MEKEYTYFTVKTDFGALDEKLQEFVVLRNELAMLAEKIGAEVKTGLLRLEVEKEPSAATDGSRK